MPVATDENISWNKRGASAMGRGKQMLNVNILVYAVRRLSDCFFVVEISGISIATLQVLKFARRNGLNRIC